MRREEEKHLPPVASPNDLSSCRVRWRQLTGYQISEFVLRLNHIKMHTFRLAQCSKLHLELNLNNKIIQNFIFFSQF